MTAGSCFCVRPREEEKSWTIRRTWRKRELAKIFKKLSEEDRYTMISVLEKLFNYLEIAETVIRRGTGA